jgi:hypothetical protein
MSEAARAASGLDVVDPDPPLAAPQPPASDQERVVQLSHRRTSNGSRTTGDLPPS